MMAYGWYEWINIGAYRESFQGCLSTVSYLVVKTGGRFVNSPKLPRSLKGPGVSYQSQTVRRRSAPNTPDILSKR
ncbi:hypothetical protein HBI24_220910 [Parastagonospora nodorum]|nr:hypothetical protein HBH53_236500 [Parastagonospora nodorum]KAH3987129.1 hypothetical protein HBH51_014590 [Parastagonospora nodorum]KAH4995766.1 hypothetical protein HBI76_012900 [Parastagonospora nodorum]KAH5252758.1 hypothetical protein HBI71_148680 [Parastagonospora nodorum]KAH5470069.1 hypothetical protein HBI28_165130 [Parastagonospora nodorum]